MTTRCASSRRAGAASELTNEATLTRSSGDDDELPLALALSLSEAERRHAAAAAT